MFGFLKKCLFTAMTFFICNALKCVLMNNQECKVRPVIMNINSNETLFYPYNILVNKCSGSCNNIINFMQNYVFLMLLETWISNYSIKIQKLMNQDMYLDMKLANVNVD